MTPLRLTIVETHPIQYNAPWFRYIARHCPELDLTVVYASKPSASQQAVGYTGRFEWNSDLFDGYRSQVVRESQPDESFDSERFNGIDVREIGDVVLATKPDVAMVAGWHSATQLRAIRALRRNRVPVLYRGDTHLGMRPAGVRALLWRAKTRAMLGQYSAHLAVGTRARDYLLANSVPATGIFASPHAVDNEFFASNADPYLSDSGRRAARAAHGIGADEFVVLFVGRLNDRKRVGDALAAVARLGRGATLLVAGHGANSVGGLRQSAGARRRLRRGRLPGDAERPRVVGVGGERGARHRPANCRQRPRRLRTRPHRRRRDRRNLPHG
jgi:glycosyltransferase involved in cell wall biosynthesis